MHQQMLGQTQLPNPHSRSGDLECVTPVRNSIGEGQYEDMQIRKADDEWRGRGGLGSHIAEFPTLM